VACREGRRSRRSRRTSRWRLRARRSLCGTLSRPNSACPLGCDHIIRGRGLMRTYQWFTTVPVLMVGMESIRNLTREKLRDGRPLSARVLVPSWCKVPVTRQKIPCRLVVRAYPRAEVLYPAAEGLRTDVPSRGPLCRLRSVRRRQAPQVRSLHAGPRHVGLPTPHRTGRHRSTPRRTYCSQTNRRGQHSAP
jgi:hypothetical protein